MVKLTRLPNTTFFLPTAFPFNQSLCLPPRCWTMKGQLPPYASISYGVFARWLLFLFPLVVAIS